MHRGRMSFETAKKASRATVSLEASLLVSVCMIGGVDFVIVGSSRRVEAECIRLVALIFTLHGLASCFVIPYFAVSVLSAGLGLILGCA